MNWSTSVFAMLLLGIFCQSLYAQIDAAPSVQTQVDRANIQRQISLLGDADPVTRQKAQAELQRIGPPAIEELKQAAKFETTLDYETQIAAARILETIQDEIAIEKTDQFVQGKTSLPGWQAFAKFAGDTPASRSLFRDIYLRNRSELNKVLSAPAGSTPISHAQLIKLFESSELEQVCFGMFLLARQQTQENTSQIDSGSPLSPGIPSQGQLEKLLNIIALPTSPLSKLSTDVTPVALLVKAIIETAPTEYSILNQKLEVVKRINSPEIGPLLVEFAIPENPTVVRAMAIAHAVKIGDAKTFADLRTYVNDATVVGQFLTVDTQPDAQASDDEQANQVISEVQIRDLVLLGQLRLAGKAHADFGFIPEAVNVNNDVVDIKLAGFKNEQDRQKGFESFESSNQQ